MQKMLLFKSERMRNKLADTKVELVKTCKKRFDDPTNVFNVFDNLQNVKAFSSFAHSCVPSITSMVLVMFETGFHSSGFSSLQVHLSTSSYVWGCRREV